MMLTLDDLVTLYPDQLWLDISSALQDATRQAVNTHAYANPAAGERAYRNLLCQTAIAHWLAEEPDLPTPTPWLLPQDQPGIWEFVNGSILCLDRTRLAIVPSNAVQLEELSVEQEWVDSPTWAAHYYLAVQLNLDDRWLRIVGYATHDTLKRRGTYDAMDRTYTLDRSQLIEDLNVLWLARETSPSWQPVVAALPSLSTYIAEPLINQLSQVRLVSPRLDAPVNQWLALLANPRWRSQLYQARTATANLWQWFQHIFEPGWQAIRDASVFQAQIPSYALAKGYSPQEKIVWCGSDRIAIMLVCEDVESRPHPTVANQWLSEVGLIIGVRAVPSEPDQPQPTLPLALELQLTYPDELGQPESIIERIDTRKPQRSVWFPKLLVQSQDVIKLDLRLNDWRFSHRFTL